MPLTSENARNLKEDTWKVSLKLSLCLKYSQNYNFIPKGTIAEKLRAAGAGIPAFYTPTGANTVVEEGGFPIKFKKGTMIPEIVAEPRKADVFDGRRCVLEKALSGDFALIKAWKADTKGNLVYRKSARNFNADMAMAGKYVIAEVNFLTKNLYFQGRRDSSGRCHRS